MKKYLLILTISIFAISCSTPKPLYNWKGYDDAVYNYTKTSSKKDAQNLTKVYEKLIKDSGGSRKLPPPGVCADYGFLLIQNGETAKGKELLIKETVYYPESKLFIDRPFQKE